MEETIPQQQDGERPDRSSEPVRSESPSTNDKKPVNSPGSARSEPPDATDETKPSPAESADEDTIQKVSSQSALGTGTEPTLKVAQDTPQGIATQLKSETDSTESSEADRTQKVPPEAVPDADAAKVKAWVQAHYVSLYRLAFAALYHAGAAHQVALQALAEQSPSTTPGPLSLETLYRAVLKHIHEQGRRLEKKASPGEEAEAPEITERITGGSQGIAPIVAAYGQQERLLLALCYALGRQPTDAARLLHVNAGAARAQIDLFRRDLRPILGDEVEAAPVEAPTRTIGELRAMQEAALDRRISQALETLWPPPQMTEEGLEALVVEAQEIPGARLRKPSAAPIAAGGLLGAGWATYRWLALGGGLLILGLLCPSLMGGLFIAGRAAMGRLNPTPLVTAYGAPTAVIPAPLAEPLTRRSGGDEIRARMGESSTLWRTLWVDLQSLQYGPQSYLGPPRAYQAQAWIRQPDQSAELFGLLSQDLNVHYWVDGNQLTYLNSLFNLIAHGRWTGEAHHLLANQPLQGMIFPSDTIYADPQAYFKPLGIEQVAGRRALLTDWYTSIGLYQARLWLDVQTGVILRVQTFGPDQKLLTSDAWVTAIGYDQNFPPTDLSLAAEVPEGNPTPEPTREVPLPTPTLAFDAARRNPLPMDAAPPGFDPSARPLTFQLQSNPPFANLQTEAAEAPFELFADGYWIGSAKFGLPWFLHCARSPDGLKLAYSAATDGTAKADESLRWLDLGKPGVFYQVLPGLKVSAFAFAPDSHRLAAFGKGSDELVSGAYVVDTATGDYSLLISLAEARSLTWSPDGEFLALIGNAPYLEGPTLFVIHLRTKNIAYQSAPGSSLDPLPDDAPVLDWDIDYPVEMGGMDDCAAPPP